MADNTCDDTTINTEQQETMATAVGKTSKRSLHSTADAAKPAPKKAKVETVSSDAGAKESSHAATMVGKANKRSLSSSTDAQPSAGKKPKTETVSADADEIVSPDADYVCCGGAEILKKHSLGIQRIPLKKLGVSPLNRKISGKHVHQLGLRIVSVESFQRYRYKYGWCHEPDPKDLLSVARATNEVAKRDKLLAPVPMEALFGSFAKTHLMSFLQACASGTIYWDHNGTLMVPPPGQHALMEHIQHGMFYEVLSWEAVSSDAAGIRSLMKSDNFDAGFALGETEMALLEKIHQSLAIVAPPAGCTDWDVIRESVARSCGQRWNEEDMAAIFNLAKVLGTGHIKFLMEHVMVHIDVDAVTVRPHDCHQVAAFHPTLPWTKVMWLTVQLFSQEDKFVAGPGGKNYGAQISKTEFERLLKVPVEALKSVESFLQSIMTTYNEQTLKTVAAEMLTRELPALFLRLGKAALLCKDWSSTDAIPFGKIEHKLRENLQTQNLPQAVVKTAGTNSQSSNSKPASKAVVVDITPSLTFDDKGVVTNCVAVARGRGLAVGTRVKSLKELRGVRKGATGTIEEIGKDIAVLWDVKSRLDSSDASAPNSTAIAMTVNSIAPLTAEEMKAKKVVVPTATAQLPDSIAWVSRDTTLAPGLLESMLKYTMYQVYVTSSPNADLLRITEENPQRMVVAQMMTSRKLMLLPLITDFQKTKNKKEKNLLIVTINGVQEIFKIEEPANSGTTVAIAAGAEATLCYPYWKLMHMSKTDEGVAMYQEMSEIVVPAHSYATKEAALKPMKSDKGNISIQFPVFVNKTDIPAGSSIYLHSVAK